MLDKARVKTDYLRVAITPDDKAIIAEIAKKRNISTSQLVRDALKYYLEEGGKYEGI